MGRAQELTSKILDRDNSGHGMDHVNRVIKLSLKFAEDESANTEIVTLIALLHDVDDYKLFGAEAAEKLPNAKKILDDCNFDEATKKQVIQAIKTIGYSKRLQGIFPSTIEGKIVSDADMCDGMGATGILRCFQYHVAHQGVFFDRNIYPKLDMSVAEYKAKDSGTAVTHIFEKLLKLKDLMLTKSGQKEAMKRHDFMVDFLRHFFEEEDVPEWVEYLENY